MLIILIMMSVMIIMAVITFIIIAYKTTTRANTEHDQPNESVHNNKFIGLDIPTESMLRYNSRSEIKK